MSEMTDCTPIDIGSVTTIWAEAVIGIKRREKIKMNISFFILITF
ncbi:MAG: hypothetical protein M0016_00225 [Deltaproteobacteria bacterium]|nr:hypothetical protein [Deltaproteobacteria bacterium]